MEPAQPLILVVGAADTGRAPMTVALLSRLLRRRGLAWSVESAGVVGHDGEPAEPEARDTMAALGLDIADHRARSLDDELAAAAGLLLAVDRGVARVLRERSPTAPVIALSELAPGSRDIPDPFRMQVGAWLLYAREIESMLQAGLPRLAGLLAGDQPDTTPGPPDTASDNPPAEETEPPAAVTIPPARAAAVDRVERLLGLLVDAPGAIDWAGARAQLTADLAQAASRPITAGDLAEPYAAIVQAMLGLTSAAPTPGQTAALRAAIARLRGPVAAADLASLSAALPGYPAL